MHPTDLLWLIDELLKLKTEAAKREIIPASTSLSGFTEELYILSQEHASIFDKYDP